MKHDRHDACGTRRSCKPIQLWVAVAVVVLVAVGSPTAGQDLQPIQPDCNVTVVTEADPLVPGGRRLTQVSRHSTFACAFNLQAVVAATGHHITSLGNKLFGNGGDAPSGYISQVRLCPSPLVRLGDPDGTRAEAAPFEGLQLNYGMNITGCPNLEVIHAYAFQSMYAVELAVQRNPALHTIEPYAFNSTDVHSDLKLSGGANVDIQAGAFAGCDMWTLDMSGLNATTMVSGALGGMLGNFQFRFSGALFEVFETNVLDPIVVPTADKQFELHNLPRLHTLHAGTFAGFLGGVRLEGLPALTTLGPANPFDVNCEQVALVDVGVTSIAPRTFSSANWRALEIQGGGLTTLGPETFHGLTVAHLVMERCEQLTTIATDAFSGATIRNHLHLYDMPALHTIQAHAFRGVTIGPLDCDVFQCDKDRDDPEDWMYVQSVGIALVYTSVATIEERAFAGLVMPPGFAVILQANPRLTTIPSWAFAGSTFGKDARNSTAGVRLQNNTALTTLASHAFSDVVFKGVVDGCVWCHNVVHIEGCPLTNLESHAFAGTTFGTAPEYMVPAASGSIVIPVGSLERIESDAFAGSTIFGDLVIAGATKAALHPFALRGLTISAGVLNVTAGTLHQQGTSGFPQHAFSGLTLDTSTLVASDNDLLAVTPNLFAGIRWTTLTAEHKHTIAATTTLGPGRTAAFLPPLGQLLLHPGNPRLEAVHEYGFNGSSVRYFEAREEQEEGALTRFAALAEGVALREVRGHAFHDFSSTITLVLATDALTTLAPSCFAGADLEAGVDLSSSSSLLTTLGARAFADTRFGRPGAAKPRVAGGVPAVKLAGHTLSSVGAGCFAGATFASGVTLFSAQLGLRREAAAVTLGEGLFQGARFAMGVAANFSTLHSASLPPRAFEGASASDLLDFRGAQVAQVATWAFAGASLDGGVDLSQAGIATIAPFAFQGTKLAVVSNHTAPLRLSHNHIAALGPNALAGLVVQPLGWDGVSALLPAQPLQCNPVELVPQEVAMAEVAKGALANITWASSCASFSLSGLGLRVLHPSSFANWRAVTGTAVSIDLGHNPLTRVSEGAFTGMSGAIDVLLDDTTLEVELVVEAGAFAGSEIRDVSISRSGLRELRGGVFTGLTATNVRFTESEGLLTVREDAFRGATIDGRVDGRESGLRQLAAGAFSGLVASSTLVIDLSGTAFNELSSSTAGGAFTGVTLFQLSFDSMPQLQVLRESGGVFSGLTADVVSVSQCGALTRVEDAAFAGLRVRDLNLRNNAELALLTSGSLEGVTVEGALALDANPKLLELPLALVTGSSVVPKVSAPYMPCLGVGVATQEWKGSIVCTNCAPGKYCPAGISSAKVCPPGTYSSTPGLASADQCTPCPSGTFSDVSGATSADTCIFCAVGTANPHTGGNAGSACAPCLPGLFGSSTGLAVCERCPAGTYQPLLGATSQTSCQTCASQSVTAIEHPTPPSGDATGVQSTQLLIAIVSSSVTVLVFGLCVFAVPARLATRLDLLFGSAHMPVDKSPVVFVRSRLGGAFTAAFSVLAIAYLVAGLVAFRDNNMLLSRSVMPFDTPSAVSIMNLTLLVRGGREADCALLQPSSSTSSGGGGGSSSNVASLSLTGFASSNSLLSVVATPQAATGCRIEVVGDLTLAASGAVQMHLPASPEAVEVWLSVASSVYSDVETIRSSVAQQPPETSKASLPSTAHFAVNASAAGRSLVGVSACVLSLVPSTFAELDEGFTATGFHVSSGKCSVCDDEAASSQGWGLSVELRRSEAGTFATIVESRQSLLQVLAVLASGVVGLIGMCKVMFRNTEVGVFKARRESIPGQEFVTQLVQAVAGHKASRAKADDEEAGFFPWLSNPMRRRQRHAARGEGGGGGGKGTGAATNGSSDHGDDDDDEDGGRALVGDLGAYKSSSVTKA